MKILFLLVFWVGTVVAEDPFASFGDLELDESQSNYGVTGYVQSSYQYLYRSSQWGSLRQRLWFEPYYHSKDDSFSVISTISIDWDPSVGARENADPWNTEVRELYLEFRRDQRTITLGKQMMVWGTGSALSQGAYFNPMDSSDPLASGLAVNYLATPALRWKEYFDDGVWELIATSEPTVNTLPKQGSMWDITSGNIRTAMENEDLNHPVEIGSGFKLVQTGYDVFIGGFYGYQDDPVLTILPNKTRVDRNRISSFFSQLNINFLNGIAQIQGRYDRNVLITEPSGVSGDRDIMHILFGWAGYLKGINAEFDFLLTKQVESEIVQQFSQNYHYEWGQGAWGLDLGSVYNFDDNSYILESRMTYKASDTLEYTVGYNGFYGNNDSNYGVFSQNSMYVAKVNIYF
ncbi:MAG: hypothetical protein JKY55_06255 [Aliivibrio sp.]|uniref:hypothetical protein n=1 Tax=Aliivibrio sp. TaxID=1872443 RepID=UPI001A642949|nr:hypothetical protein [Aliivibrio sp.]